MSGLGELLGDKVSDQSLSDLVVGRSDGTPSPAAPNPYSALLQGEADRLKVNQAATLTSAVETSPDKFATQRNVARYLGYSTAAVEATPEASAKQAQVQQIQQDTLQAPVLAQRYTQDDWARLAHDDSRVLALLETTWNSFRRGVPGMKQNMAGIALGANAGGIEQVDRIEAQIAAGQNVAPENDPFGLALMTAEQRSRFRASTMRGIASDADTIVSTAAERAAIPQPAVVNDVMAAKGWREAISAFTKDPLQFIAAIGPESLVQSAPGIVGAAGATATAGPVAGAAVLGLSSGTVDYGSSLLEALGREGVDLTNAAAVQAAAANKGLMARATAQAMAHATVVGGVDGVSGGIAHRLALPAKVLSKAPVARELANMVVQTPLQGALGGLGEAGGELASGQPLDPGNILAEVVGEAFTAPAEVAAIAGGHVRERMALAAEAKTHAEGLAQVAQAAMASKLRQRDPATFADFANQATDNSELFIDAHTFAQSMPPEDLAKLVAAVPAIGEQLAEAQTAGGDISINTGDFAAYLAGTPAGDALMPHVRSEPDAMTAAEAQAYRPDEDLRAEVERLSPPDGPTAPTQQDQMQTALASVRDGIAQQLDQAGRFTPAVNRQYVDLLGAFISTTAERAGLPVDQLQALVPRIVSQLSTPAAQTLDQAPTGTQTELEQGTGERRGAFDPSTKTIALLEHADLSTFLHETGHFFLDAQANLATRTDVPAGLKADMQTVLQWFGVPDVATWNGMTLDQQRPYHEQFARGFEAYLAEGTAPSIELQGAFARFRSWLMNVYRSLASLNVKLSPDVRGVMARMLASDAQIRDAEASRSMQPLFESAQAAGMTPQEFAAYQAHGEQATEAAVGQLQSRSVRDLQMISNAKAREVRKLNAEAKAKRDAIEAKVRAEVDATPIYAAWRDLTRGHTPDGQPIRLSQHDLAENYPQLAERVPQAMRANSERALPADMVAEAYGLSSGDELVKLLATLDKPELVIEAETDQRMLEQHGELSDARAVEQAAHAAIANDVRTRVLATEVNALAKATGSTQVLTRAARQFAEAAVARRKVRDLRPAQNIAAEARAGKAAAAAFKAGNTVEAAAKKREQLLQHVLGKTTRAALGDVDKAIDYLSKFDNASTRAAIGPDYADQIDQLLERFDLRTGQSLKAIDKRKSLAEWVEQQEALGLTPAIDDSLLADAKRQSYRDMTVEQLRGLVDTVKNIEHLGRLKQRLLTVQDQRTFDALVSDAAASIVEHGGKIKPVELEGRKGVTPWLQGVLAAHRKLGSLVHQMDGGRDNGVLYRLLARGMNDAGTREAVMTEKATQQLVDIYKPVLAMKGGITGAKVFIPEINASLTRGARLSVALNWGNSVNRQRVTGGDNWSASQVQAILHTLSPAELHFVNRVHEFVDSFWPEVKAKQLRVTGVVEDKVEAEPWTATASDGSTVEMRGGYYPIKYDSDRSAKAEAQEAAEVAKDMLRGAFTRATTRRGHTQARVDEVLRPVRKDLSVLTEHVNQVVHDLAWHEWIIDANRLIGAKPIDGAIRSHYGPDVVRTMRDDLMGIATGDVVPQTKIDKAMQTLRSNVSRSTMGYSFTTALMQPFGLTQSMARIGAVPVLRGMARWGGDALRFENSLVWIGEKSDFMRLRNKTFNRELHEINGRVLGKSKAGQVFDASLFYLTTKAQAIADVPTWIGRYEQAIDQGLDESAAVAQADEAVLASQGGGQTKDLSELQRKHPMLTSFYSYFATTLNLTIEKTATTDFRNPRAVAGWLADMALLTVIPAIGPALITDLLKGENDADKWRKKLAQWQASYLLSMVVGARELSGAVSGYSYTGPPVGRIVGDIGKAGEQVAQGEVDEPAVMAMIRLMGSAFGIPTVQAIRSYKGWVEWSHGRAPASSVLFGPPSKD